MNKNYKFSSMESIETIETIELWTGYDHVNVEVINERTGFIKDISINLEYSYDDMVLYDSKEKEILQILKSNNTTKAVAYDVPTEYVGGYNLQKLGQDEKEFSKIEKYFSDLGINTKKHDNGLFLISISKKIHEEDVEDCIRRCPVKCYLINEFVDVDEEEDDEDDGGILVLN